ncbi:MAG: type II secretion system protein [Patescibacteria group bacterium]|nr:type II secretion system protein [Patescibacteria group bacterium]MDD5715416.1 type II secretion system protein [Patescibacteria group bacterium]
MRKINNRGQTILEMLVAITILVIALVATAVLIVTSIRASKESRNRLIASNLAREAIEIARNMRDSNWLNPQPSTSWDSGLAVGAVTVPRIDPPNWATAPTELVVSTGFSDPAARVWFDNTMYVQGALAPGGSPTEFYRVVYLNPICGDGADGEMIADPGTTDTCGNGEYSGYATEIGVRVLVEIRWPKSDSHTKEVLEDRLYNWQVI